MTEPGKFIVLEGPDGAGTTTQADAITYNLPNAVKTAEPSNGPIGSLIRQALGRKVDINTFDYKTMSHLFVADRWWHLNEVIIPRLKMGTHVICDRYHPSTLIYQSIQDNKESFRHTLAKMRHEFSYGSTGLLYPSITLYLQVPKDILLERMAAKSDKETFEASDFALKVIDGYETWYNMYNRVDHIECIDGSRPVNEVTELCVDVLKQIIPELGK